ncbi:PcfJ domain-containing protein [Pontimicrobium sp. IMCC45349]|uniref:PcfJ domain-containing protein n=1 Tax=Pontimicrobium sp. IMCC45349 TaxID=3391574 RepID=UPI00399EFDDA
MKTICNTQNRNIKHSSYLALVEAVFNENNKPQRYKGTVESMLREFFSKISKKRYTWKRETFKKLLIHLYNQKCYALLRSYNHVAVVHNISAFGNKIVRDIEDWENHYFNADEQVSSLLKFCFAQYETPPFLEQSFYYSHKLHMLWYVQLGSGKSVKNLSQLQVKLTNKMAHEFRNAPSYFAVNEALRYAQALGFGATKQAAKLIAYSRLSIIRDAQEDFWSTVVQFFAKVERLETNELNQIIDYLGFKYREDSTFSMKGRTFNALLHQTNEWHRRMYINRDIGRVLSWKSSGIQPLYKVEIVNGKKVVYKTIELQNSIELYDEGMAMQHCVAEYDEECCDGTSSIFSLQMQEEGKAPERLATLEVGFPRMEIVQAKAKCNQEPNAKAYEMINHWINHSKLNRKNRMAYERPYQPAVYVRAVECEQMTHQGWDIAWVVRIIWIVIYLLFVISRAASSQSNKYSFEYKAPYELEIYNSRLVDSILEASYKVNWPKDSVRFNLKEVKWQNLN